MGLRARPPALVTSTPRPPMPDSNDPLAAPTLWLAHDPRFALHRARGYHPERPERLVALESAIGRARARFEVVPAREATHEELARVHAARYIDWLAQQTTAAHVDPDTYVAADSAMVARLAAGSAVEVVERVLLGPVRRGVAVVRPPGHHALADRVMGFCLVNNVAVAAAHARSRGLARVAIVDFDVHHGNGTQAMFEADPSVLYLSIHQFPFYPGTGAVDEIGLGEGEGYTVNLPLRAGADDGAYRGAFERFVLPALDRYAPELVLVSAGFDAAASDPLGEMLLSSAAFGWMTEQLARVADAHASGRIALVLEGGYDLRALEEGFLASLDALAGLPPPPVARNVDHVDLALLAERLSGPLFR